MSETKTNSILVIGGPNVGKTHFGGQLYGRLNSQQFTYKIDQDNRPEDLSIFREVLDKLCEGKSAARTEASANKSVNLKVKDDKDNEASFSFPDYAGEQINLILHNRQVDTVWKQHIDNSTAWMLFIRLDKIKEPTDIITKGILNSQDQEERNLISPPSNVSDSAFYVELLQILLYVKKVSSYNKIMSPRLLVVLSCWDTLKVDEGIEPKDVLKKSLPMLYHFLVNNWSSKRFHIAGLSSTQKTLSNTEPDEDFIDMSPINFGYYINEYGEKNNDLTLLIDILIGK